MAHTREIAIGCCSAGFRPPLDDPVSQSDAELVANFELDNVLDSHAFTSNRRNERVRIQSGWIRKSNTTRSVGNVGRHPPLRI
jgi:hypothetical protein